MRGVAAPLHARALVLCAQGVHFAWVCIETCTVSSALRSRVLEQLERHPVQVPLEPEALLLSATHGPSIGLDDPGFEELAQTIANTIADAYMCCQPALLRVGAVEVPLELPIAFNRSLQAFARHPDAPRGSAFDACTATRRRSTTLRIDSLAGEALGLVNWFAVGGTTVHDEAGVIHGDNKSFAAAAVERQLAREGHEGFVAIFAQEACADVSPHDPRCTHAARTNEGADAHELDAARRQGEHQAHQTLLAHAEADRRSPLAAVITCRMRHIEPRRDDSRHPAGSFPLQLIELGALRLVALPASPTTMAGHRIRRALRAAEFEHEIVITALANDALGELATPEEVEFQVHAEVASPHERGTLPVILEGLCAMRSQREHEAFVPAPARLRVHTRGRPTVEGSSGGRSRSAPICPLARGVDGCFHPADEAEVAALVAHARAIGGSVRVVGARHSYAAAIHARARPAATDLELRLDRLDWVRFDEARREVEVGAGCHLGFDPRDPLSRSRPERGLIAQLEQRGWALPCLGGITHQTLAGYLATGSAGGSTRHALSEAVVSIRFVDGCGTSREWSREDAGFHALSCSLGLLGVMISVRLRCEPSYGIRGSERAVARGDAPFRLDEGGARGLFAYLDRHDYARVLWWPQPQVERFVLWEAERSESPGRQARRDYEPFPRMAGSRVPMQAAAGAALRMCAALAPSTREGLVARLAEATLGQVYRSFIPLEPPRSFHLPWHEGIPLDDKIAERWMPVSFTEAWVGADQAAHALRRLSGYFAERGYAGTQHFVCELYAAKASEAWLSPGSGRDSLRFNFFWLEGAADEAERDAWFAELHQLLDELDVRYHWGKHTPRAPALRRALAERFARRADFLRLRRTLDPDGVFASEHWRSHGLVEEVPESKPERAGVRPPRASAGAHVDDPAFGTSHTRPLWVEHEHDLAGSPTELYARIEASESWSAWVPGLRASTPLGADTVRIETARASLEVVRTTRTDEGFWIELCRSGSLARVGARLELHLEARGRTVCRVRAKLSIERPAALEAAGVRALDRYRARSWLKRACEALAIELERARAWRVPPDWSRTPPAHAPLPPPRAIGPLFRMQPAGAELLIHARSHLRVCTYIPAPPARVEASVLDFMGADQWLANFLGVRWHGPVRRGPGALFDEHFSFMTLRVRTLELEPGARWLACIDGCSLPLATRMVEQMRFEPCGAGGTQLHWHIAFDAPRLLQPGVGFVGPMFRAWMERCLAGLARHHADQGTRVEDPRANELPRHATRARRAALA